MKRKGIPTGTDTLDTLIDFYLHSEAFKRLKAPTQVGYEGKLKIVRSTVVERKPLGRHKIDRLKVYHLTEAYEQWLIRGTRLANYNKSVLSAAWRHAMRYDVMMHNPISLIKTQKEEQRTTTWTRDQVSLFLGAAYGKFQHRSIGLILHMAYDWGQRVGDMRMLKWDNLDLEVCRLDIKQSKRGASVHLPIGKNLCAMLVKQKEDFGFQEYVAPRTVPREGAITPYDSYEIGRLTNKILDEVNLPRELNAMDLRRTAVTEMLEASVDAVGIRQVTGHKNMQSVTPYMVNTFSGASKALAARGNDNDTD